MRSLTTALLLVAASIAGGCASTPTTEDHGNALEGVTHAIAVLSPTAGNDTAGWVTFVQEGPRVIVTAHVTGLQPNATHAWHVHEFGDISGPDGKATGGHYNPEGHQHDLPHARERHAGDLGNLTADASGVAHKELTVVNLTVAGSHNPVIGRAIIVHAKADDGGQPTGNAGARIAQGVIGIDKAE